MTIDVDASRCRNARAMTLALALALPLAPLKGFAQQSESDAVERAPVAGQAGEQARTEPTVTGAERLKRLQNIIKLDEEKLEESKKDVARRVEAFEELNRKVEAAESELAEKRERLQKMGGHEASQEAADLNVEIETTAQRIAIAESELELMFSATQTIKGQIQALEQKIANEQRALDVLLNPPAPESEPPATETQAPSDPQAGATPPTATQMLVPGSTATTPSASAPTKPETPETAEQIEARRVAEKLETEARRAEQELVSFVERKQALDDQIEMEQGLLDTARKSRDNLDVALDTARTDLERLIDTGARKSELQRGEQTIDTIQKLQRDNRNEIDRRRAYLDTLYKRREALNQEQLAVTAQVEAKRKEAAEARKHSIWLESPLHPYNIGRWAVERGPRILMVILVAWALLALVRLSSRRIARALVARVGGPRQRGSNRADTLALSFQSALSLFIYVTATLLAFQESGVDIKTVLGGAAILGVAFAFGAQNLMRDYFTGFMIVLEDQYELGDLVTIGPITGTVEKVNMRTTVLRDLEGKVHFIPNGEIKSVTNRTYVWGRAVLDIPVSFKEDPDRVMAIIKDVEEEFRADPAFAEWVTEEPVMLGVDRFSEYGMVIKTFVQTQPDKIFQTRRELLRRIKNRFDREGIEISVPHRTLLQPETRESTSNKPS